MKKTLKDIIKNSSNWLTSEILNRIVEQNNPEEIINKIIRSWCKHINIKKFNDTNYINFIFENYYDEIEQCRKVISKYEDSDEILDTRDIKKYFVHLAIEEIVKNLYDDLFIRKLQKIALSNDNTLTSEILCIIINSKQPKFTFEKLVEDKAYQTILVSYKDKDFYHKLFDTYYDEIDSTIKDLIHCWSEIEIAKMSDIKFDLLCVVIDYIITWVDDEMVFLSKKESRF